jgi:hypothetical protein
MKPAFAVVLACLLSVSLSAQWPLFVRPDVTRTADMYEANYGQRQIFTDGRPLPAGMKERVQSPVTRFRA